MALRSEHAEARSAVADAVATILEEWRKSQVPHRRGNRKHYVSYRELSRRVGRDVGVTVARIISESSDPRLSTLTDIGRAIGYKLRVSYEPLDDND